MIKELKNNKKLRLDKNTSNFKSSEGFQILIKNFMKKMDSLSKKFRIQTLVSASSKL